MDLGAIWQVHFGVEWDIVLDGVPETQWSRDLAVKPPAKTCNCIAAAI